MSEPTTEIDAFDQLPPAVRAEFREYGGRGCVAAVKAYQEKIAEGITPELAEAWIIGRIRLARLNEARIAEATRDPDIGRRMAVSMRLAGRRVTAWSPKRRQDQPETAATRNACLKLRKAISRPRFSNSTPRA